MCVCGRKAPTTAACATGTPAHRHSHGGSAIASVAGCAAHRCPPKEASAGAGRAREEVEQGSC